MEQTSVSSEKQLRSMKAPAFRLEELEIESYRDGVVALDFELQVLAANGAMQDLCAMPWPGEWPCALQQVLPVGSEEYEWFSQMMQDRICYRNHVLALPRSGKVRTFLVDSYLLRDEVGHSVGMCLFFKDIGNVVSLDQQWCEHEKLSTLGKVAAGVAHEIRNPLTSIKGFLQMMRHELESHGMNKEFNYTSVMLREIERVDELVGELLLLSKPRELRLEQLDVGELAQEMESMLAGEAQQHQVEMTFDLTPVPTIYADRVCMKQVLFNLVKNGIEALDEAGGGRLSITTEYVAEERQVRLHVTDTGPGIPHYLMDRIFDAFFTTKEKGMGLGLPICQRLVNDVGGQIKVKSKGYGTTFTVLLPVLIE